MTHLGIQHVPDQRYEPTAEAASLDMLAAAAAATDPHHHRSEVVRFLLCLCIVISIINCLLILCRIHVLAIVGSDVFVCLALCSCTSHFGYIKAIQCYMQYYTFCISLFVPPLFVYPLLSSIEQLNCF